MQRTDLQFSPVNPESTPVMPNGAGKTEGAHGTKFNGVEFKSVLSFLFLMLSEIQKSCPRARSHENSFHKTKSKIDASNIHMLMLLTRWSPILLIILNPEIARNEKGPKGPLRYKKVDCQHCVKKRQWLSFAVKTAINCAEMLLCLVLNTL